LIKNRCISVSLINNEYSFDLTLITILKIICFCQKLIYWLKRVCFFQIKQNKNPCYCIFFWFVFLFIINEYNKDSSTININSQLRSNSTRRTRSNSTININTTHIALSNWRVLNSQTSRHAHDSRLRLQRIQIHFNWTLLASKNAFIQGQRDKKGKIQ